MGARSPNQHHEAHTLALSPARRYVMTASSGTGVTDLLRAIQLIDVLISPHPTPQLEPGTSTGLKPQQVNSTGASIFFRWMRSELARRWDALRGALITRSHWFDLDARTTPGVPAVVCHTGKGVCRPAPRRAGHPSNSVLCICPHVLVSTSDWRPDLCPPHRAGLRRRPLRMDSVYRRGTEPFLRLRGRVRLAWHLCQCGHQLRAAEWAAVCADEPSPGACLARQWLSASACLTCAPRHRLAPDYPVP